MLRLTLQRLTWQAQFTSATPANPSLPRILPYRRSLTLVFGPATREPEGKLKYIHELQEYEFSSTNIFKH